MVVEPEFVVTLSGTSEVSIVMLRNIIVINVMNILIINVINIVKKGFVQEEREEVCQA